MSRDIFYYFDKPINFYGVNIYPARVKDYIQFYSTIDILTINKNRTTEVATIKMSYFEFIYKKICDEILNNEERESAYKLYNILSLSFQVEYGDINIFEDELGRPILFVKGVQIDTVKFDELRKIICEYNMVEIPDDKINPEIEKALNEAREFTNKNATKLGSIEEQLICVMLSTSLKLEDIAELTIRKFQKILERADQKMYFQLYKIAESNGAKFDKEILHWRAEIKQDKNAGLYSDYNNTSAKFGITQ